MADVVDILAPYIHIEKIMFSSLHGCFKIEDGNKTCNK